MLELILMAAPIAAQHQVQFAATVRAGENYRKDLGGGLAFVLQWWEGSGWGAEIRDENARENFIACVTPPFHGSSSTQIDVRDYVTQDNQRRATRKEGPGLSRGFNFVLNARDQTKACRELEVILYMPPKKDPQAGGLILGTPGYEAPPVGEGSLEIKSMELADLGKGKQARFVSMRFEALIDTKPRKKSLLGDIR